MRYTLKRPYSATMISNLVKEYEKEVAMRYQCKCGWDGDEDELVTHEEYFSHHDSGNTLADNSWVECPECGGDPEEMDDELTSNDKHGVDVVTDKVMG